MRTLLIAGLAFLAGCSAPQPERRSGPFSYGWTGIDQATTNVFDPYIQGRYPLACADPDKVGEKCIILVKSLRNRTAAEGSVVVVVKSGESPQPQRDANALMAAIAAPAGCLISRNETTRSQLGYIYGFSACGAKDGLYQSLIVSNRWGHAYLVIYQSSKAPAESDLIRILEDIRFPA